MKILFLDIDGVLNNNTDPDGGIAGIHRENVQQLNTILAACPELKVILSSAWRYRIISGQMTCSGFEFMLQTHGCKMHNRLIGTTCRDGHGNASNMRSDQIMHVVDKYKPERWCVLDDDYLAIENFVQTNGRVGLTPTDAQKVIQVLNNG